MTLSKTCDEPSARVRVVPFTAVTALPFTMRSAKGAVIFFTYSREPPQTVRQGCWVSRPRKPWLCQKRMRVRAGKESMRSGGDDQTAAAMGARYHSRKSRPYPRAATYSASVTSPYFGSASSATVSLLKRLIWRSIFQKRGLRRFFRCEKSRFTEPPLNSIPAWACWTEKDMSVGLVATSSSLKRRVRCG